MTAAAPVVVLGGGACGMSAALELTKLGLPVVVLEREATVGTLRHPGAQGLPL